MKTTANVYLISTNKEHEKDGLYFITSKSTGKENLGYTYYGHNPHHLYITLSQSDLEISKIKEGDWCYIALKPSICQYKKGMALEWLEKIIATTDEELSHIKHETYSNGNTTGVRSLIESPSISKSFIEHHISEFNKGNVIKTADVELEEWFYQDAEAGDDWGHKSIKSRLKLNPDNEISIIVSECNCMELICDICEPKIDKAILERAKNEVKEDWSALLAIKNIPELPHIINSVRELRRYYIDALQLGYEKAKKEMYTRKEVEKLCKDAYETGSNFAESLADGMLYANLTIRHWIKENLK
jgi:hypothetical protein